MLDDLTHPVQVPIEGPHAADKSGELRVVHCLKDPTEIIHRWPAKDQPFGFTNDEGRRTQRAHSYHVYTIPISAKLTARWRVMFRTAVLLVLAVASPAQVVSPPQPDSDPSEFIAKYRKELEAKPNSSLAHFQIGEILLEQKDYQPAANEFREALNGDLQPDWVQQLSHARLGEIFEASGQHDRALNELRLSARGVSRLKEPIERVPADYTEEAWMAELEGTVIVSGVIGDNGYATDLRVEQPLGLGLDEKAMESVAQWLFERGPSRPGAEPTRDRFAVDFTFPSKQSRWHLIWADFRPPEGASRPAVSSVKYPAGAGLLTGDAIEEGRVLGAVGRPATVTLSFEVDELGIPVHFQVVNSSEKVWENEAIAVVSEWRFKPGAKQERTIPVSGMVQLVWGARNLSARSIAAWRAAAP